MENMNTMLMMMKKMGVMLMLMLMMMRMEAVNVTKMMTTLWMIRLIVKSNHLAVGEMNTEPNLQSWQAKLAKYNPLW